MGNVHSSRLCWNCEGDVDFSLSECPYCGSHLQKSQEVLEEQMQQKQESFPSSPYAAPPQMEALEENQTEEQDVLISDAEWDKLLDNVQNTPLSNPAREGLLPFILLNLGGSLLVLCAFMFFFANQETLILHWEAIQLKRFLLTGLCFCVAGLYSLNKQSALVNES